MAWGIVVAAVGLLLMAVLMLEEVEAEIESPASAGLRARV
jgi:hypothetical protein